MNPVKAIRALRGAVRTCNTPEEISAAVTELYDELLRANGLGEDGLVSLFFSVTPDINALNPASALRREGRAPHVAMMVFQEAETEGSLPGTIRALAHCYLDQEQEVRHIYIRGAEVLRPDRAARSTKNPAETGT
ncbi:MAG: chorismate mutase [Spirochaetaceae bacterium]|nr:chorismate mutase [Spirochaetaceae bacterium]